MAPLIYSAITSLDGYVEDAGGHFDWAAPGEEVLSFLNDVERPIGTYLLGRRMYETMAYWDTPEALADPSPAARDFTGIWRAADKIVYSRTLEAVSTERTRIATNFDPGAIQGMKAAADCPLSVAGAELAAQAIRAGLVDELHLFVTPVSVGGGKQALPDGVRVNLELLGEHRFDRGVVHLHYRTVP
jgi:dihydrofolate reductase